MHLELQFHAETLRNGAAHAREQRRNVFSRSIIDVVDEVRMQRRDFRAALAPSLSPGRFDEAGRLVALRIAKARTRIGQRDRLRVLAAYQTPLHLLAHLVGLSALELQ